MPALVRHCSLVFALSMLAACGEVELSCEVAGDVTPLCGVQMPEDLEVMPNGGGLLIGEYGNGGKLSRERSLGTNLGREPNLYSW